MKFFTGSVLDVLMLKQQVDPPPPRELVAGIPDDLNRLCISLLARDPASRPSGTEVLRILDAARRPRAKPSAPEAYSSLISWAT